MPSRSGSAARGTARPRPEETMPGAHCHTVEIGWGMSVDLEQQRERRRENSRRYRERNRGRVRERERARYAADPQRGRERQRQWRERNLERARELDREGRLRQKASGAPTWKELNPDRSRAISDRYVLKGYGLTPEAYDALSVAQGGRCAICGSTDTGHKRAKRLFVDHCHRTGAVRGLLCNRCNTMLGNAADSSDRLRAAAAYLERSSIPQQAHGHKEQSCHPS